MKTISKEVLKEARRQLAQEGYAAMSKKHNAKERQEWRKKGGMNRWKALKK